MTDNINKGTQKSDIRAQYNKENKTEETTGNKNITYVSSKAWNLKHKRIHWLTDSKMN